MGIQIWAFVCFIWQERIQICCVHNKPKQDCSRQHTKVLNVIVSYAINNLCTLKTSDVAQRTGATKYPRLPQAFQFRFPQFQVNRKMKLKRIKVWLSIWVSQGGCIKLCKWKIQTWNWKPSFWSIFLTKFMCMLCFVILSLFSSKIKPKWFKTVQIIS